MEPYQKSDTSIGTLLVCLQSCGCGELAIEITLSQDVLQIFKNKGHTKMSVSVCHSYFSNEHDEDKIGLQEYLLTPTLSFEPSNINFEGRAIEVKVPSYLGRKSNPDYTNILQNTVLLLTVPDFRHDNIENRPADVSEWLTVKKEDAMVPNMDASESTTFDVVRVNASEPLDPDKDINWCFHLSLRHFSSYSFKALVPLVVGALAAGALIANRYIRESPLPQQSGTNEPEESQDVRQEVDDRSRSNTLIRKEQILSAVRKERGYGNYIEVICRSFLNDPLPEELNDKVYMGVSEIDVKVGDSNGVIFTFHKTVELSPWPNNPFISKISRTYNEQELLEFTRDHVMHVVTDVSKQEALVHCTVSSTVSED